MSNTRAQGRKHREGGDHDRRRSGGSRTRSEGILQSSPDEGRRGREEEQMESPRRRERAPVATRPHHHHSDGMQNDVSHEDVTPKKGKPKMQKKPKGAPLSLEEGLKKVAAPSLERQDFGRDADDGDTFVGSGTVDGEVQKGKLNIKHTKTQDPFAPKQTRKLPPGDPFGGRSALGGPSPFGGSNPFGPRDNSDSEDEDDDVDVFTNPYTQSQQRKSSYF